MFATSSCVAGQQERKSLSDGHDASMHINASGQNFAAHQSISDVDRSTPTTSLSVRSRSQFTRYNRLFNRFDNRLYRVNGVSESCVLVARLMPRCRVQTICRSVFILAALWNRAGHYIFVLWFLSSFFFPRLISAVADWMSTILLHMAWP